MNTSTKMIFAFCGGAAIGSLISFALLKERFSQIADEEIKAMKEHYEKEFDEMDEAYNDELDEIVKYAEIKSPYDTERKKGKIINYAKAFKPEEMVDQLYSEEDTPTEEDDYFDEDEIEEDPEYVFEIPFVISLDDFNNTYDHFDKITITYFDGDGTLADDQDEVIEDIDSVIGLGSLDKFGLKSEDENIVHVRNLRLGADYEVVYSPESYGMAVLGMPDNRRGSDE